MRWLGYAGAKRRDPHVPVPAGIGFCAARSSGRPLLDQKGLGFLVDPERRVRPNESAWVAAVREFAEETGVRPSGVPLPLGEVMQSRAKRITAFALKGELETSLIKSNVFHLEWPPKSGRIESFPEVDRAEWFPIPIAKQKIVAGQKPL